MQSRELTLTNPTGLHARPAVLVVQQANRFASDIRIYKKGNASRKCDAKSILSLLALGAGKGAEIIVEADGPDEDEAIEQISLLINLLGE